MKRMVSAWVQGRGGRRPSRRPGALRERGGTRGRRRPPGEWRGRRPGGGGPGDCEPRRSRGRASVPVAVVLAIDDSAGLNIEAFSRIKIRPGTRQNSLRQSGSLHASRWPRRFDSEEQRVETENRHSGRRGRVPVRERIPGGVGRPSAGRRPPAPHRPPPPAGPRPPAPPPGSRVSCVSSSPCPPPKPNRPNRLNDPFIPSWGVVRVGLVGSGGGNRLARGRRVTKRHPFPPPHKEYPWG